MRLSHYYKNIGVFFLIAISVFLIYSNSFKNPFHFDDIPRLKPIENAYKGKFNYEFIKHSLNLDKKFIFYRPLAGFSLAINYYISQRKTWTYHIVNVAAHAFAAMFLFLFLQYIFKKRMGYHWLTDNSTEIAAISAILWAIHPIQTQAVTYIVQRMAVFAGLFFVASFYFYSLWREKKRFIFFILCIFSGLLSFTSKEHTAILPVLLFIYEWLFFQNGEKSFLKRPRVILLLSMFILFIIGLGVVFEGPGLFTSLWNQLHRSTLPGREFSLVERLLTESRVIFYYISLIIFPTLDRFNLDHDFSISHSLFDPPQTIIALLLIFVSLFAAIIFRKKFPLISFTIFWYFGTLLIESSIIALELIFEHRAYLPSMMIFPWLAIGLWKVGHIGRFKEKDILAYGLIITTAIILGYSSFLRNYIWSDPVLLWQDCAKKSPYKARVWNNLGSAYSKKGYHQKAIEMFKKAIDLKKDYQFAYYNLGVEYANIDQDEKAVYYLRKAVQLDNKDVKAWVNLASSLLKLGRLKEAKNVLNFILERWNKEPLAYMNLALYYYYTGNYEEAEENIKKALSLNAHIKHGMLDLAIVYKKNKDYAAAIQVLGRIMKRGNAGVYERIHLADAYIKEGNIKEAYTIARSIALTNRKLGISMERFWHEYLEKFYQGYTHKRFPDPVSEIDYYEFLKLLLSAYRKTGRVNAGSINYMKNLIETIYHDRMRRKGSYPYHVKEQDQK